MMDAAEGAPTILGLTGSEIEDLFQKEARLSVARLLESGEAVYSSGVGNEADRLTVHLADGRRLQYRVTDSGHRTLIDDDVA